MKRIAQIVLILLCLTASGTLLADSDRQNSNCKNLPGHGALKAALKSAVAAEASGLNFDMWATIVDRDGVVCAVAFSGTERGSQWPGSRVISAQKANTANAFGLDGLALSTANLYSAVQPGGACSDCRRATRSGRASRTRGLRRITARETTRWSARRSAA